MSGRSPANRQKASPQRWLNTRELAALLEVDDATVYRWLRAGKVRPSWVTPGGQRRYRADLIGVIDGVPA